MSSVAAAGPVAVPGAAPSSQPKKAAPEAKPVVPAVPDSFNRTPAKHDASAQAALHQLEVHGGPTISASELVRAIVVGTRDADNQSAGTEYSDFKSWTKQHASKLTAGATQVMAEYTRAASVAQAHHQTGMSDAAHAQMLARMLKIKDPPASPATSHPPSSGKTTAHQLQHDALANPNHVFMRQVYSPKFNPHGPAFSGNCAVTSLAMAAKAYGALTKPSDPQKFIEKVGKLTGDRMTAPHNFQGSTSAQIRTGARALKMHGTHIHANGLDAALAKGHMVVLTGTPGRIYRAPINKLDGNTRYGAATTTRHSILVMGKDSHGRYVVADPLSQRGVVHLTAAQMHDFTARWNDGGTEVWRP